VLAIKSERFCSRRAAAAFGFAWQGALAQSADTEAAYVAAANRAAGQDSPVQAVPRSA
jgi:hypothetical protein